MNYLSSRLRLGLFSKGLLPKETQELKFDIKQVDKSTVITINIVRRL